MYFTITPNLTPRAWSFTFDGVPATAKTTLDADKTVPYFVRLAIDVLLMYLIEVKAGWVEIDANGTVNAVGQTYHLDYDWYVTKPA